MISVSTTGIFSFEELNQQCLDEINKDMADALLKAQRAELDKTYRNQAQPEALAVRKEGADYIVYVVDGAQDRVSRRLTEFESEHKGDVVAIRIGIPESDSRRYIGESLLSQLLSDPELLVVPFNNTNERTDHLNPGIYERREDVYDGLFMLVAFLPRPPTYSWETVTDAVIDNILKVAAAKLEASRV